MIIIKRRDGGAGFNWIVGHSSLDFTANETLTLDSSTTIATWNYFNATAPSSSVFYLGTGANTSSVNGSGGQYVAWCYHSVSGFSKFGSYTGTGTGVSQGVTGLGFSPNWVMIKETDGVDSWQVYDTARGAGKVLYPNGTNAEYSGTELTSFDSDGFTVTGNPNESGKTYIYAAFKVNPSPVVPAGQMAFLNIAGGASGGIENARSGGGGGAGGFRTSFGTTSGGGASAESNITLYAGTYTITVGAGGASSSSSPSAGNDGSLSSIAMSSII